MSCGSYSYIFIDACFVSNLRQLDSTCELLNFFGPCADDATCVLKMSQYNEAPCNHFNAECSDLDNIFSDEDAIDATRNAILPGVDLSRIVRDPADVKAFIWASTTPNSAVLTCDRNLLYLCRKSNIPHRCFKAAIKALDIWLGGAISQNKDYNITDMQTGPDPFYHYSSNHRCVTHCGLGASCICFVDSN